MDLEYQQYREFSSSLANGLVKGSEVLGRGMVRGAVKGSELIFHGADYMKQYITPEAEAREVDPRLAQGLAAAAWVSKGACRVSGWLVSWCSRASSTLTIFVPGGAGGRGHDGSGAAGGSSLGEERKQVT